MIRRVYLFIIIFITCTLSTIASQVSVKASLDSVNLKMGNMTFLHLNVSQPENVKGSFPILSHFRQDGIIPLCGDSVELRAPSKIDTVKVGNKLDISYYIPLQAFDSGYYRLPKFVFVTGNDSTASNQVSFKVYPVLADADTTPYDYASVSEPDGKSFFDFVPDFIIDYWWIFVLAIFLIVGSIFVYNKYRKQGYLIPHKPQPTPYEEAISSLTKLSSQKLWQQGMEKEYFTELTDILRRYLYGRFGINAIEMTSRQIIASLKKNKDTEDKRQYFRQILDMADFVKFAKVRPLPDDNVLAFDNAMRFVKETKPVETSEDNQKTHPGKGGEK